MAGDAAQRRQMRLLAVSLGIAALLVTGAERGADGEFDKRTSSHFTLYQDVDIDRSSGLRGSRRFEQQVLAVLESAYDVLGERLGLRPMRRITVVVYDPAVFDQRFYRLFRFPAAGFYHGVIRIRGDTRVHLELTRVLHHELVHAAFDQLAPSYGMPAWLNEGLAEWLGARAIGQRHLSASELAFLSESERRGQLLPLLELSLGNFGHLPGSAASLAYLQSRALVDHLGRRHGERSLRELSLELVRTRDLDRTLRRVFRRNLAQIERDFRLELQSG